MRKLSAKTKKIMLSALRNKDMEHTFLIALINMWNAKTPHFGGSAPHRYDDNSKECGYCLRPFNWVEISPNYASEILYSEENES